MVKKYHTKRWVKKSAVKSKGYKKTGKTRKVKKDFIIKPKNKPSIIKYGLVNKQPIPDQYRTSLLFDTEVFVTTALIDAWQAGLHYFSVAGNELYRPMNDGEDGGTYNPYGTGGSAGTGIDGALGTGWTNNDAPAYYTAMFNNYNKCLVYASHITLTVSNNTVNDNLLFAVAPANGVDNVAFTLMKDVLDHPYTKSKQIGGTTPLKDRIIKNSAHVNKIYGDVKTIELMLADEINYSMLSSVLAPAKIMPWTVYIQNMGSEPYSSYFGITMSLTIKYDCVFYGLKNNIQ